MGHDDTPAMVLESKFNRRVWMHSYKVVLENGTEVLEVMEWAILAI